MPSAASGDILLFLPAAVLATPATLFAASGRFEPLDALGKSSTTGKFAIPGKTIYAHTHREPYSRPGCKAFGLGRRAVRNGRAEAARTHQQWESRAYDWPI